MNSKILFSFVMLLGLQTAFARSPLPKDVPCKHEARVAVSNLYTSPDPQLIAEVPMLSIFSSDDQGNNVRHYVKAFNENGNIGMYEVVLEKNGCKEISVK